MPGPCPEGPRLALPRPLSGLIPGFTSATLLEPTRAFFHSFGDVALLGLCVLREGGGLSCMALVFGYRSLMDRK